MERRYQLLEMIDDAQEISVKELALAMAVSEVTIRKDLNQLVDAGLIQRRNGQVSLLNAQSMEAKIAHHYAAKQQIAQTAAAFVNDGDTIFIDEGSTNAVFAKEVLLHKELHVITNSLYIANILTASPSVQLTFIGGTYNRQSQAFSGPLAKMVLNQLAVEKVFVGANGYSSTLGFTCNDFGQVEISTLVAQRAQSVYVLADANKFASVGLTSVVPMADIDYVITDQPISDNIAAELAAAAITLNIADTQI